MSTLPRIRIKSKGGKVDIKTGSLPRSRSKVAAITVSSRKPVPEQRRVQFLRYEGYYYCYYYCYCCCFVT